MRCQQRKARRCPKRSSDVLEADPAPPADALELLPERYRRPIAGPVGISVAEVGPGADVASDPWTGLAVDVRV